jgi:predicted transcriptional regulator
VLYSNQEVAEMRQKGDNMNVDKLKGKVKENQMTQEQFAKAIGIDRSTLDRRYSNSETFKIGEVNKAVTVLCLSKTEAADIFLPQ